MQLANNVRQELLTPPERITRESSTSIVNNNDELETSLARLRSSIERTETTATQQIKPIIEHQLEKLVQRQPSVEEALRQPEGNLQNTGLLILIDRLVNDKDDLNAQLTELSRYNTHLRKVNLLYETQLSENNQKIQELRENLHQLQGQLKVSERIQLLDNKAKLQEHLLRLEVDNNELESELLKLEKLSQELEKKVDGQHNPQLFIGSWLEEASLKEIHYDTMGINIPETRSRSFKLTKAPDRTYGAMAILETTYDYRTNTLWKRRETMTVEYFYRASELKGELVVDFMLEGKSVAKATYLVTCSKQ
jgi:chromosome segregation ATPase